MKEYIEREVLIGKISELKAGGIFTEAYKKTVLEIIANQPTAKVQEVRYGKWTNAGTCTNCGFYKINYKTPYCPQCGANMDEE